MLLCNVKKKSLKMLGCFNPNFGSNMDKPNRWVKKKQLGLSIFDPNLSQNTNSWLKQPSIFYSMYLNNNYYIKYLYIVVLLYLFYTM